MHFPKHVVKVIRLVNNGLRNTFVYNPRVERDGSDLFHEVVKSIGTFMVSKNFMHVFLMVTSVMRNIHP